ncbi:MAG TPA: hypothetical protein VMG59_06230 [Phycisphaerae bacterium]|nr:hypothetical protein [Phycisphaerae bacterium]
MRNKILVYLIGFAAALLLFLWIRSAFFSSSSGPLGSSPQEIKIGGPLGVSPLVYENRDPQTGDLLSVIRAQSVKPAGVGRYQLVQPQILFYTNNGQCIQVTSDAGNILVDQVGGAFFSKMYPRSGSLYGNVAITVGPIDSFQPDQRRRLPGQIQVLLGAPLNFDYQEGLLTSPGSVRLRGDQVAFDGSDLTVEIDVTKKVLNYLQVTNGQRLVIRNVLNASRQNPALAPVTQPPSTSPAQNSTTTVSNSNIPAPSVYQLSFGHQVEVSLADRNMSSYSLSLLFSVGVGGENSSNSAQPAQNQQPGPPTTAPSNTADSGSAPIDPQHDLVVDWTGPLKVQPYQSNLDHLLNSHDVIVKATGQSDEPVVMHDGDTRTATADEVDYETANQTLKMISLGLQPVTLIDNTLGTLTCRTMIYENLQHRVSFFGPGHLQTISKAAGGGPWQGQWNKGLTLSFAPIQADIAGAAQNNSPNDQTKWQLQNAIMTGDATLAGNGTFIAGDMLFADISSFISKDKTLHQALSYFGATGDVTVRSWRPGDPTPPDSISCHQLQLITTPIIPGNPHSEPVPSLLLADGAVAAVFHDRAGLTESSAPGAAGNSATNPGRQTGVYQFTSEHLSAALVSLNAPAAGNSNLQTGHYTVGEFRLWQNLQVQILGDNQPILATAYQLSGDRAAGTVVLSSSGPGGDWPKIQQGLNYITGEKIMLFRTGQSMQIDGPGQANMPSDVAADNPSAGDSKTSVTLHWSNQMFYHGARQTAEFDGDVTALMTGQKDPVLTCSRLQVLLYKPQEHNASLKLAKIIALSSPQQPLVIAQDSSSDAAGNLLTRLYMTCTGLTYDAVNGILDIPNHGEMLLEDYRPAQPGEGQERGRSAFTWDQLLEYHAASGVISLTGNVQMVFQPEQPFNANSADLGGALPMNPGPDSDIAAMTCKELSAQLSRKKTQPGTSMSLGLGGQSRLQQVQALQGALKLSGILITADVLEFDATTQQAVAYSLDGREATVQDDKGQYHGEYEKAIWDTSKGRSGLELINPRGTIQVQQ